MYCLNCLHSFRTENKLKPREKVCKNKDFCGIVMPSEKHNILVFNQDCMRKFSESLREHVKNIIDFEKKKMLSLT